MVIHQCDICGKEIGVWIRVSVEPNAAFVLSNVGHLIKYSGEYEICEECFENLLKKIKTEKGNVDD